MPRRAPPRRTAGPLCALALAATAVALVTTALLAWRVAEPALGAAAIRSLPFTWSLHRKPYDYRVCLFVANFNQSDEIPAWIEYHLLVGVDHFFFADDCSTDDSLEVLRRYEADGVVTLFPQAFYQDCDDYLRNDQYLKFSLFQEARKQCEWVGHMDLDEFVGHNNASHFRNIYGYLQTLDPPIARLLMVLIGSDGVEDRPKDKLVIETFSKGGNVSGGIRGGFLQDRDEDLCEVKTIARNDFILNWTHAHFGKVNPSAMASFARRKYPNLNEDERSNLTKYFNSPWNDRKVFTTRKVDAVTGQICYQPRSQDMFLYHYKSRSWREWSTGRAARPVDERNSRNPYRNKTNRSVRQFWERFNLSFDCTVGNEYKAKMAVLVHEALARRASELAIQGA